MSLLRAPVFWFVVLMTAVLWPSRFIGPLDGAPLDRPLEAIVLGLALPWLFWLGRGAAGSRTLRVSVLALLAWKVLTPMIATQQGLCANVRAPHPLSGLAFAMRIDEPHGALRSWDLRADLWDEQPACTAIITRPLMSSPEFPAWFVNISDQMLRHRSLTMKVSGVATTPSGSTPIAVEIPLDREPWQFNPQIDGAGSIDHALLTVGEPTAIDRALAPWAWVVAPLLCLPLLWSIGREAVKPLLETSRGVVWVAAGVVLAIALALAPIEAIHRTAGLMAFGALAVGIQPNRARLEQAVWIVGAPWLAFFAAFSFDLIGRFSPYSMDDWLAYQIAGYRIYMNGNWIEAGSPAFDYQALYRWITGALHLVFGDSSVGEVYWDASFLLIGGLLAHEIVRRQAGWRWGIIAAALALSMLTIATPWYVIGRGLGDISAAGFGFLAVGALLRAQSHGVRWAVLAGIAAALMFYARINHLLWAAALLVMLLPLTIGSDRASLRRGFGEVRWKAAAAYVAVFVAAIVAFMARTKYFTGHWSLFYGTSLRHNDTGLRPWTMFDAEPWSKVAHSLTGLVFMNEPPAADPRSLVLIIAIVVIGLVLLQLPIAQRIPAALVGATIAGAAGALVAHSHAYPGRFTVHLIPLASALTAIAMSVMFSRAAGTAAASPRLDESGGRVA